MLGRCVQVLQDMSLRAYNDAERAVEAWGRLQVNEKQLFKILLIT